MYNQMVRCEFDPATNETNIAKHGVDVALAELFELENAVIEIEDRFYMSERKKPDHISR
jgi:uncharacterized DUF497 family protein